MKKIILFLYFILFLFVINTLAEDTQQTDFFNQENINVFENSPLSSQKIFSLFDSDLEPAIFKDINIPSFQTLSGYITFTEKDNQQKLAFSPFRLLKKYTRFLSDISLIISQKEGITNFGFGFGLIDTSSPDFQRKKKNSKFDELNKFESYPVKQPNENDSEYAKRISIWKSNFAKLISNILSDIRQKVIKISFGYNIQFFKIISGDRIDKDMNNLMDNEYAVRSHNFSLNFSSSFLEKWGLYTIMHYSKKRAASEEGQKLVPYYGGSIGGAFKLVTLDRNYMNSLDYLKNGFIPSIALGATFEYQKCTGENIFCENGIKTSRSITPYLDVKIAPSNQFRIGVPIRKDSLIAGDKTTNLGVFIQYNFQLANL